jgi:hypothetical protein
MIKTCPTCKEAKPTEAFSLSACRRDGLSSQCKACQAAYRKANTERRAEYLKKWREENKAHALANQRRYREENKDKVSTWSKEARLKDLEGSKEISRASRAKARSTLADAYVRPLLAPGGVGEVPPLLLELKRLELKIKREVKRRQETA